jgi:hypothetical protein
MASLLYKAADSISTASSRHGEKRRPDREERFVLEHYGRHKTLRSDVILNGSIFKQNKTSLTKCCANMVSRSQYILQLMTNMVEIQEMMRAQLVLAGRALQEQGLLYDDDFPMTLRNWIINNALGTRVIDPPDVETDVIKSTIEQLILLNSIQDELY